MIWQIPSNPKRRQLFRLLPAVWFGSLIRRPRRELSEREQWALEMYRWLSPDQREAVDNALRLFGEWQKGGVR